jgi:CubicO group peptidase (beta-lactamase class C family)
MSLTRFLRTLLLCALGGFVTATHGAQSPSPVGLDPAKLKEIPARMQKFVEEGAISGAVTLVARRDSIAALDAVGLADLGAKTPMRTDTLFWIASMTKPITAAAVLMLQDESKLSVDDPVEKHLPEFKGQWLVQERSAQGMTLVKPPRVITLRDLLTHTSGIGDVPAPRGTTTLAELVMACAREPLQFEAGSRWSYSNAGINTLGRIVEVVSGMKYEDFLRTRFFEPLGMKETTFWPTKAQARRVAKSYQPSKSGQGLEETEIFMVKGALPDRTRTPFPSGGLFSTAGDIGRFYQMMLNGGAWRGRRLLSHAAVDELTRTQTGDLQTGFTNGMSYGLGFAVVKEPKGVTGMLSAGTFGHGGAYGTQSWADPQRDLILVLMIQRAKLPNADASDIRRVFQEIAAGRAGE